MKQNRRMETHPARIDIEIIKRTMEHMLICLTPGSDAAIDEAIRLGLSRLGYLKSGWNGDEFEMSLPLEEAYKNFEDEYLKDV